MPVSANTKQRDKRTIEVFLLPRFNTIFPSMSHYFLSICGLNFCRKKRCSIFFRMSVPVCAFELTEIIVRILFFKSFVNHCDGYVLPVVSMNEIEDSK